MEIIIKGEPNEIAALVLAAQGRRNESRILVLLDGSEIGKFTFPGNHD